jgi:hypothetical protein
MDEILLSDIPNVTIQELSAPLHNYSTALFRVSRRSPRGLCALHIGSGTYASIGETYGIITAQHVAQKIDGPYSLGLAAAREAEGHQMIVQRSALLITDLGLPRTDEYGPDLAFMALADWDDVATVRASRAFLPLESDADFLLGTPPANERGIWFLCGAPEERVHVDSSRQSFEMCISYEDLSLAASPSREIAVGGHDYIELDIEGGLGVPASFAGMSGGGLWQVLVARAPEGHLVAVRYLLVGVTFFQGIRPNGTRFVRCHGRRSIYDVLAKKIHTGCA